MVDFIKAPYEDKAAYVLDLYDQYVVHNDDFPAQRRELAAETIAAGGKVLLEGPQSYWLSNSAEKFWDSGTSASTDAAGMLSAARLNLALPGLVPLVINIHKTPGSSRVGSGANPCAFVPQNYFSHTDGTADDFKAMELDWRDVSRKFFDSGSRTAC